MNLAQLIIDSYISVYENNNAYAFSLPHIFDDGTPAMLHAHKDTKGKIILTDSGLNIQTFAQNFYLNQEQAIEKVRTLAQHFKQIKVQDGAILITTTVEQLSFDLLDYQDLIQNMIHFKPKAPRNYNDILQRLEIILSQQLQNLVRNPQLVGRSGGKYHFSFGSGLSMIDFSQVDKNKTNTLLRKYLDVQHIYDDLDITVILNDLENDKYKSEQIILSDFATVKPLSKLLLH